MAGVKDSRSANKKCGYVKKLFSFGDDLIFKVKGCLEERLWYVTKATAQSCNHVTIESVS